MAKVITFSRTFPAYHPKAGEPTYFVEKVIKSLPKFEADSLFLGNLAGYFDFLKLEEFTPKYHTIRAGSRWKEGDRFSPRIWSGKPYTSKQITIAPDTEIKKVWDVVFIDSADSNITGYDYGFWCMVDDVIISDFSLNELAKNDGLSVIDLVSWFNIKPNKTFKGQIICWNENISY